jgi:TPR repeat protein
VKRDDEASVVWLRRSALQGHAQAQYALGLAYAEGRGVAKDAVEAYTWFRQAASNGSRRAAELVKRVESRKEKVQPLVPLPGQTGPR